MESFFNKKKAKQASEREASKQADQAGRRKIEQLRNLEIQFVSVQKQKKTA